MIATDLSKQQTPDTDPKAMGQINFTGNLEWEENANAALFFIILFLIYFSSSSSSNTIIQYKVL